MTNKVTEAIAKAEEQLGKPLSAYERLNVIRSIPKEDDTESRMTLIFEETLEGIESLATFNERLEAAKQSSGIDERRKVAFWWETEKRSLLTKFNAGQIERIGKQAA